MILVKRIICLVLLASAFVACKKEPTRSNVKEMLEFTLLAAQNKDALTTDISGVIEGFKITLVLPQGIDLSEIVATFRFTGKSVLVDRIQQVSGSSKNNFNRDFTYNIEAEDGSIATYEIVIKKEEIVGSFFNNFSFQKELNDILNQTLVLNLQGEDLLTARIKATGRDLIASFDTEAISVKVAGVDQVSGKTINNFSGPIVYELTSSDGIKSEYVVSINWEKAIPTIHIETQGNAVIESKEDYVPATLRIEGMGFYPDYTGTTGIRGRGNSTWTKPKKPYRLKLDKKASILGLKEEKDWVLLANHYDKISMLNPVAMEIGHLLHMPYTNHIIPVDLYLNGEFQGSYQLTEQVEVSESRVDIEDGGQLFEIDSYFDEDYKFYSDYYKLPMQVKYPKLKDLSSMEAELGLADIKKAFNTFEAQIYSTAFPKTSYLDQFDRQSLVNFLIVNMLVNNAEINHPKSTYMHKPKNGKYTMGPLWDFDWAFSYDEEKDTHFNFYNQPLFNPNASRVGSVFFLRLLEDPAIKSLFKSEWSAFRTGKFSRLLEFIDGYAALIEYSQKNDVERWKRGSTDFKSDVNKLKSWIQNRANYMDSYVAGL